MLHAELSYLINVLNNFIILYNIITASKACANILQLYT